MAKHRFASRSTALAPRPFVISVPARSPSRARRVARHVGGGIRRGARHVRHHAGKAMPTMAVALGGLAVGYLQGKGFLDKLPQIGGSKVLTLGLAGWAATRFIKNPTIRTAGLAALAAAAVDFGRVQGGGTSGFEDVQGHDSGQGPFAGG